MKGEYEFAKWHIHVNYIMIKFDGNIVQFGFGAVGKSFYEKVSNEIRFYENNYFVISKDKYEFDAFVNLGGIVKNFIICDVTKENFSEIFEKYLSEGDLLIDFADTVGTKDICDWCAKNNIMYINTGEADWPDNWYSILNENKLKQDLRKKYLENQEFNKHPIVLQHGDNPGLVSHFVKAGLEYIINNQYGKNKELKKLLKENKFNEIAYKLGLKMIHVNDIDLQKINDEYKDNKLFNTWCIDSFFFEMLSEATINIGTHENIRFNDKCKKIDEKEGFIELNKIALDVKCNTYYPNGKFEGFLVPHEETITIAKALEVKKQDKIIYRPTVVFLYSPCEYAKKYFENAKVNSYPDLDLNKPQDCENENGKTIIRGCIYPEYYEIVYKEKIESGTEYVGVLLLGEKFDPVWVGNRVELEFLYKNPKDSYWQTPTITPVSMSALSAVCWMIKNKNKGGIYFPDDILDYKYILKIAEKYISKIVYKTFKKEELEKELNINLSKIQFDDFFVK